MHFLICSTQAGYRQFQTRDPTHAIKTVVSSRTGPTTKRLLLSRNFQEMFHFLIVVLNPSPKKQAVFVATVVDQHFLQHHGHKAEISHNFEE